MTEIENFEEYIKQKEIQLGVGKNTRENSILGKCKRVLSELNKTRKHALYKVVYEVETEKGRELTKDEFTKLKNILYDYICRVKNQYPEFKNLVCTEKNIGDEIQIIEK